MSRRELGKAENGRLSESNRPYNFKPAKADEDRHHKSPSGNLRSSRRFTKEKNMSKKLIEKIEKKGGNLYGAVDVPDGEYGTDDINKRVAAQQEAFTEQYPTTGDSD